MDIKSALLCPLAEAIGNSYYPQTNTIENCCHQTALEFPGVDVTKALTNVLPTTHLNPLFRFDGILIFCLFKGLRLVLLAIKTLVNSLSKIKGKIELTVNNRKHN